MSDLEKDIKKDTAEDASEEKIVPAEEGDLQGDSSNEVAAKWEEALKDQGSKDQRNQGREEPHSAFVDLEADAGDTEVNLDLILDIPVTLSVEIGRAEVTIQDLLKLSQGSIVDLKRDASEPMDVLVNGTLIAHGEVVMVEDRFAVRLTEVLSAAERIRSLK